MRRSKIAILAVALLVAGAAGYTAYWFITARILEGVVADWVEAQRARGYRVEIGRGRVVGFPAAFRMSLPAPVIEAPPQAGGWRWEGPPVAAEAELADPWRIRFVAGGRHVLTAPPAGGAATWTLEAGTAEGWVHLSPDGGLDEAGLGLTDVDLTLPGGGEVTVAAAHASIDPRRGPSDRPQEAAVAVRLTVERLWLPQGEAVALGGRVDRFELDALLRGLVPSGPPAQALRAWRDGGGVLDVRRVAVQWGALQLSGDGSFALDAQMQPSGAVSAVIRGLDPTIEGLAKAEVLNGRTARLAALASAALAKPGPDGTREVRLPLSIQERTVFLGPLRLMRLPAIRWE